MAKKVRLKRYLYARGLKRELRLLEGMALALFLALIVGMFALSGAAQLALRSGQGATVIAAALVDLANDDRTFGNIGLLKMSPVLTAAAQAKADDMASGGYFAHVSPDGKNSWYWFKEAGYAFDYAGENLAVDFSDSADVERAWMNSPTHRQNLLDPHFTEIGIAIAEGVYQGHPTTFVVQMFASPAKASAQAGQTVKEITSTKNPAEPAIAKAAAPVKVLGSSSGQKAPAKQNAATAGSQDSKEPIGAIVVNHAPSWGSMAASPKTTLKYVYYILAFFILLALFLTTGLEFKWHHRRQFVVAACLLVFMSGLFITADRFVFPDAVLTANASMTSAAGGAF